MFRPAHHLDVLASKSESYSLFFKSKWHDPLVVKKKVDIPRFQYLIW